jgi:hypothetical protein
VARLGAAGIAFGMAAAASAATLYVSPAGNDTTGNGSQANPYRQVQRAINATSFTPGSEIIVADGTYAPFFINKTNATPANRYTIRAAGNAALINGTVANDGRNAAIHVTGSHITIDGFVIDVGKTQSDYQVNGDARTRGIRVSGEAGAHVFGVRVLNNRVTQAGWVGITASYAENVLIEGNTISFSRGQHGIYVTNTADGPIIRRNVSFENAFSGIQINGDPESVVDNMVPGADGIIRNALVEQNVVYANKAGGSFDFASIRDSRIINNLAYDNTAQGFVFWDDGGYTGYGCIDNLIANNTVIMPSGSSHAMRIRNGSTGNTVLNNILIHLGGGSSLTIDTSSLTASFVSNHNIVTRFEVDGVSRTLAQWRTQTGDDLNSLIGNTSVFTNYATRDLSLAAMSPARDAGTTVAQVTHDHIGTPRPQGPAYDIGAYEAAAPSGPPGAPTIGTATAGVGLVSVTFAAPAGNGGSPITSYTATCGTQSATGGGSPLVVTGLAAGVAVTCTVIATNLNGNSPPSAASNSVVPIGAPGAPVFNQGIEGDTQITASFTAPASDGGSAITQYAVLCTAAGQPDRGNTGTFSPITVGGLVNGLAYTCAVFASNAAGSGPPSASLTLTPSTGTALALTGVVSRRTHGAFPHDLTIDASIPVTGAVSIEPRLAGTGHRIVFQFNQAISAVGNVSLTAPGGMPIGNASASFANKEVIVAIAGLADNQRATIAVDGVNGLLSASAAVGFFAGDVSRSRIINAVDVAGTKARGTQAVNAQNFVFDVNVSGTLDAADISIVKSRSGRALVAP